jgi:hypothetical protein
MIRLMKLAATLLISLQTLAWGAAHAREEQCAAPPYGASIEAYNAFIAESPHSGPAQSPTGFLARICRMKYDAADRTELYRAGFTPEDIEHSSTVMLTSEYLGVLRYVAFQNTVHGQAPPKPDAPLPPPSEYQTVSVRDFATEGPKLAAANAKVSLSGLYILQDNHGVLYADRQAIVMARFHPEAPPQPHVPLLIDAASKQLRQRLVSCQTDLSAAQVGCAIKIRGQAGPCPLTEAAGATHELYCVNVEDGK